jgi:hydrogenase expression/formation protein HypC
MCLALPARVVELRDGELAVVDLGGVRKEISIALVPEARVGDYVIVHVGHALGLIDPEEAARTLELFAELGAAQQAEAVGMASQSATNAAVAFSTATIATAALSPEVGAGGVATTDRVTTP